MSWAVLHIKFPIMLSHQNHLARLCKFLKINAVKIEAAGQIRAECIRMQYDFMISGVHVLVDKQTQRLAEVIVNH